MSAQSTAFALTDLDRRLLDEFQRDFPLDPRPFATVATRLGMDEGTVIARYRALTDAGYVSRVGAVVRPHAIGASTLAAMSVPAHDLERVAALVSGHEEVNHNYEREHDWNLWFVLTAPDADALARVVREIEQETGHAVMQLPLEADYHIDLGFPLQWT